MFLLPTLVVGWRWGLPRTRDLPSSSVIATAFFKGFARLPLKGQSTFLKGSHALYCFTIDRYPRPLANVVLLRDETCTGTVKRLRVEGSVQGNWLFLSQNGEDASTFRPSNVDAVFLYAHGGAFLYSSELPLAGGLVNLLDRLQVNHGVSAALFAVHYRTVPEYPFPGALDDMAAAYKYLEKEQGVSAKRIFFIGDSAGGNLVTSLGLRLALEDLPQPGGIIAIAPWLDLSPDRTYREPIRDYVRPDSQLYPNAKMYSKSAQEARTNMLISPICADSQSLAKLANYMLVVGDDDVFYEESIEFIEKLDEASAPESKHVAVIGEDCPHVYALVHGAYGEAGESSRDAIAEFVAHQI